MSYYLRKEAKAVKPMYMMEVFLVCLTSFSVVLGCGQLPQGQTEVVRFTVRGTRLPTGMAYSGETTVQAQVATISRSEDAAKALVQNLIVRAIEAVLEQQGRSALLPDVVISQILQQLSVNTTYSPLECKLASTNGMPIGNFMPNMGEGCFVTDDFVTMLCATMRCNPTMPGDTKAVPSDFMTLTGTIRTSNIIMANWSRQMWADILRRVQRQLSSVPTPFGTFFGSATVTQN